MDKLLHRSAEAPKRRPMKTRTREMGLNYNKSPGPDSLPVELLKYGGEQVCTNSRGIALLSTAGKVLAKVLCKRLITHIMERIVPETQWGFRPDRSTNDMIFVARQFFEKCRETCRLIKGIRHCPTWYVEESFFKGWLPTKICQFGEAVSWWNGSIGTDRRLKLGIIWGSYCSTLISLVSLTCWRRKCSVWASVSDTDLTEVCLIYRSLN